MPVNPNWTASDVLLTLSLPEYQNPDGKLTFTTSTVKYYDNETSFTGAFTTGEIQDFILVDMKAGATYDFLASGDYQVTLSLFDSTGHLLVFTDGDEIGIPDSYPRDSILDFKPDYTGTYKLYITYSNLNTRGNYFIVGSEDIGSNGVNDHLGGGSGGGLDNSNPILTAVRKAMYNVGREDAYSGAGAAFYTDLGTRLVAGKVGVNAAFTEIVNRADNTASVATLSYEFFTGHVPTGAGFDYLLLSSGINPNNLYSAYYQNFNLENRYINFAVNLGKIGEGKEKFAANYGALSLAEATKKAYAVIFGAAPTDAKVAALLSGGRDLYFESYGHDGLNGIGTKAAMVGWLLAEAEKADVGMYAKSNFAFLTDLALGQASYGIDLVGVYGKADYAYGG